MPHKHFILYAEDDPDDLFMVRQAFELLDGEVDLMHASNGYETMEQLRLAHFRGTLPCLVILDINMPGMDGRETLMRIKQTDYLQKIPVILFSTSSSATDRAFAETWDASFITKPLIFSELEQLARNFLHLCSSSVPEHATH